MVIIHVMSQKNPVLPVKEWNSTICNNMDGPRDYDTKSSQAKTNIIWYCIYIYIYIYSHRYVKLNHIAISLKWTPHCKSAILQLKIISVLSLSRGIITFSVYL